MTRLWKLHWKRWAAALSIVTAGLVIVWITVGGDLLAWYGRRLVESREHEIALKWLERSVALRPADPELHFQLARVQRRMGQVETAAESLSEAGALGAAQDRLAWEKQLLALRRGELPQSVDGWRRLLERAGSDLPEVCESFVYFRLGRFETDDAMAILDAWQKDYPEDAQPHYLRGQIHRITDSASQAEAEFRKAAKLAPQRGDILYDLAAMQIEQLQLQEARDTLQQLLALNPDNHEAQVLYARALRRTGNFEDAERILQTAMFERPESTQALTEYGELQLTLGRFEDAVEVLTRVVKEKPVDREVRYLLAQALQRSGHAEEARREYEFVEEATTAAMELPKLLSNLSKAPEDLELRYRVALLTWKYKSREEGYRAFQDLLAISPHHVPTHRVLADHFRLGGDDQRADYHAQIAAGNIPVSSTP